MKVTITLLLASAGMPGLAHAAATSPADPREMVQEVDGPAQGDGQAQRSSADTGGLAEIVVTAQRRVESAQRAAISIDTVSPDQITRAGLTSPEQLTQLVPALRVQPEQGPYANFTVRGITNFGVNSFADGAVLLSVGGIPLAHPVSSNGLFYDLERIEVLKGPQGTLYGRNATGGAVNLIAQKPEFAPRSSATLELGNYDRKVVNLMANAPLGSKAALRVALQRVKRDGYFSDATGDEDTIAARASLRVEPSDGIGVLVVADISHDEGFGAGSSLLTSRANPPRGPATANVRSTLGPYVGLFDRRADGQFTASGSAPRLFLPVQDNTFKGVSLQLDFATPLGDITFLNGYRDADLFFTSSMPTFYFGEATTSRQYSSELRVASDADKPFRYVIGGFYLDDKLGGQTIIEVGNTISNQIINNTTRSWAGFGQATYALSDSLRFVGGIRYTHERKTTDSLRLRIAPVNFATTSIVPFPATNAGTPNLTLKRNETFKATTWKAGIEWDAAPDSLVYANASSGFKAGGFFFGPADNNSYDPEKVIAYVVGTKNRFLDRKLQVNVEGYYLDYTGQQISYFGFTSAGTSLITSNVGKATIYGIEGDLRWRATATTQLGLNVQWQHGTYDRFTYLSSNPVADTQSCPFTAASGGGFQLDCSGKRLLQLPTWILAGSISQRIPLANDSAFVIDVSSRYEGARETALVYLPETRVGSYTRTDASLTWNSADKHLSAALFVRNIENDAVVIRVQPGRSYSVSTGGLLAATYQSPRTYGARIGFNF
ncbi:TonB-dependent receptor [Novosphingobium sp.]|uniref:TonB-dependent receptor n=1 Tax=Novosphingobium sp. TaxID=1874826 RepID=UPI0035629A53